MTDLLRRYSDSLAASAREGLLRVLPGTSTPPDLLDFSGNDYMGLARRPELVQAAAQAGRRYGAGATGSRLLSGNTALHMALEARIAQDKGTQAALVFSSGYQANAASIAALLDKAALGAEPLVFADRLNHASMHLGCTLAGARQFRYRHLDLAHLQALLEKHENDPRPRFILSESVFGMDGDQADVAALQALALRFGALLYLDEAHATGVFGPNGFGLAETIELAPTTVVMGTFSKALGGYGSFVCCSSVVREYLVNRCAGFIFSTALPPPCLGSADAALDLAADMESERQALQQNARRLRDRLAQAGLDTAGSSTQIVPVLVGPDDQAMQAMRALEDEGVLAAAVRPPTVPPGTSRLRLSLTAAHTAQDVDRLCETIIRLLGSRS